MKIYTKKGDKGITSDYGGNKVSKSDSVMHAVGKLDSLNSEIGLCITMFPDDKHEEKVILTNLQHILFDGGSIIATPIWHKNFKRIDNQNWPELTSQIEHLIDVWDSQLPKLTQFILPGGHPISAKMHVIRTICRETERYLVDNIHKDIYELDEISIELYNKNGQSYMDFIQFINRLSDFFFQFGRYCNKLFGVEDVVKKSVLSII